MVVEATNPRERADRTVDLAATVRRRRRDLGLGQEELADLAACSERFVQSLEAGKASVRLDKVLDVLHVLGLHLVVRRGVDVGVRSEVG